MTPSFVHPIEPFKLTQGWGTYDPATYSQFGFTRHNGLDLVLSPDKHIFSPFKGTVVRRGFQPQGGGIFIGIISDDLDFPAFANTTPEGKVITFVNGTYRVLVDLLHCESILVNEGDTVEAGQLVAIGDNTGFSTGPHCHSQWRRVTWDGKVINTVDMNDANDSFDPTQFFSTKVLFTKDLSFGMSDPDVKRLQVVLNASPATQIAASGVGSPGMETEYFGALTQAAVKRYQVLHKITPVSGYVGPLTRSVLNA